MSSFTSTTSIHRPNLLFRPSIIPSKLPKITASSSNPILHTLKIATTSALLLSAALCSPKLALSTPLQQSETVTTKSDTIEASPETIHSLKTLLFKNLKAGLHPEALTVLHCLLKLHPSNPEYKFIAARILTETGNPQQSRKLYEEILSDDPSSFEAHFENAILMDRTGAIAALEKMLEIKSGEENVNEREVRLIEAQIEFLRKNNVEAALESFEKLAEEDEEDYRPWFCLGVIYRSLGRNVEAREMFNVYRELSPRKFAVEAFLLSPRMLKRIEIEELDC